jgi:UDP-3-O-[3-hydroxymyristoyl] glucosamine N-acyltransferase
VTIDRATVNATTIGAGTKIDDGVHVAHNVVIGKNGMLCGQVGIAGSAKIGDWVVMGGQAGINPHVTICDQAVIGGKSGVISDVAQPGVYSGHPAQNHSSAMRQQAALRRLPDLLKQMKELELRVEELSSGSDGDGA